METDTTEASADTSTATDTAPQDSAGTTPDTTDTSASEGILDPTPTTTDNGETTPPNDGPDLSRDLMDLAKSDEDKAAEVDASKQAAREAYFKDSGFDKLDTDLDLGKTSDGKPVSLTKGEARTILSALAASGIPADKARNVLAIVGAYSATRANAEAKAQDEALRAMRADAYKQFGDGLSAAVRDMNRTVQQLFPPDLAQDLLGTPALSNDPRFIRAMQSLGRLFHNDNGGPDTHRTDSFRRSDGTIRLDLDDFFRGTRG